MLENDVEYVVLQAKNYILSIVGWRPISYFSPSRDFASTWPCHHHLDSSLYRFNPKAANWLMLLLLVKHNLAFFGSAVGWIYVVIFQSVYVVHIFHFCMVSIAFLKKISPNIFVFYCKCSKYTKPFIFLYCIYGLIIIKHLVVLLINIV